MGSSSITRTVVPVVWTPDLSPIPSAPAGIAPTDFSAFLTPKNETNGWLWGVGPVAQIPTITSADLGSNLWGGGPAGRLDFLDPRLFWVGTPRIGGWKSLDFLGFSRPNCDLSTGYA